MNFISAIVMNKILKISFWSLGALSVAFTIYLMIAGQVSKELTKPDIDAIKSLKVENSCSSQSSFNDEITCILAIQSAITSAVTDRKCAAWRTSIEPESFLQRGYGCCYDRARFVEKALNYYGFETRHVALYDRDQYGYLGLLVPLISSHATSEVKTQKGWMGVDSNEPFILLSKDGGVSTYKNYKKNFVNSAYSMTPKNFYEHNLIVIYGLYSRHGMFHGLNLPSLEFNLKELIHNFSS
jgi:hypothetical protein